MQTPVIDKLELERVKNEAINYINLRKLTRQQDLVLHLIGSFQRLPNDYFDRGISELVQDNLIHRTEFKIPDYVGYVTVYLPAGSFVV